MTTLTSNHPMNLRDVRPKKSGVLPKGMPAYLAFLTNCIRYLFGKSTPCELFFRPRILQKLTPLKNNPASKL
jgi:hypothetical protein